MPKAKKTVDISRIVKKAMHRPLSKDGYTLYPRVDNFKNNEDSVGEEAAYKSQTFLTQSKSNYNSPTNIRKVFITGAGVAVQYYTSMITGNKQSVGNWKYTAYDENENLFKIVGSILNYDREWSRYLMEKNINAKAEEPDRYVITKHILNAVSGSWVCNNIEELYYDWTVFISPDTASYFPSYYNNNLFASCLSGTTEYKEIIDNQMINVFKQFNMGGAKDFRHRFPRLKMVGMISNLDAILKHPKMIKVDSRFSDLEAETKTWYEINKPLIQASKSLVLLSNISQDLKKLNTEFIVRDNFYKFDFKVLKAVVSRHKVKVEDYVRQKRYGTTESAENEVKNTEKELDISSMETQLVDIEKQYGDKVLKNAILYAVLGSNLNTKELKEIFKQFTKPNRKRMASMAGIDID